MQHQFHDLTLVEDARVPADNFVLTNDKGKVLAGGDVAQGLQWKAQGAQTHGPATKIHAPKLLADKLLAEAKSGVVPNGHSNAK